MPQPLSQEEYIKRCVKTHGDTYDYSKTAYKKSDIKVTITCKIHGDFEQWPRDHYRGRGCNKCAAEAKGKALRDSQETFIKKANTKHNDYYTYNNANYVDTNTPVIITCPVHGDFTQQPNPHIQGAGCPECGKLSQVTNRESKGTGWTSQEWEEAASKSKYFEGFTLYVIRCWSETEEFIKIGKTFRSVPKRFTRKKEMPYEYEILHTVQGSAKHISHLEINLQKQFKLYKYLPKIGFHGQHECFSKDIKIKKEHLYDTRNNKSP